MEELILYLASFGNPTLWRMRDGEWACTLNVFVTGQGCTFEVKHMKGASPLDALMGCKANLESALAQFQSNTPTLKG